MYASISPARSFQPVTCCVTAVTREHQPVWRWPDRHWMMSEHGLQLCCILQQIPGYTVVFFFLKINGLPATSKD